MESAVTLVSPVLSGLLLSAASIELIFFINVFAAITGVLVLFTLLYVREDTARKSREWAAARDFSKAFYMREAANMKGDCSCLRPYTIY